MKNFFKATGFLFLAGLTYLTANMVPSLVAGVAISIKYADELNQSLDTEAYTKQLTQYMSPYILPITIMGAIVTIGLIALYFIGRKDRFISYVQFKKISARELLAIGLFGLFLNLLFIGLLHYADLYLPIQEQMEKYNDLMELAFSTNFVIVFIATVITAPLFEEILLRGIVFNDFKKACPTWVALIIQALIFGLMHMNLIQGTYAFILGLILGVIYYNYQSIWASITLHMTFNLTSTLLTSLIPNFENHVLPIFLIGCIGSGFMTWLLIKGRQTVQKA